MKNTTINIVLAMLCLNFGSNAQGQSKNQKPLSVGDTIPTVIWKMPLQVVNHPYGKKAITLNDYKGKLIILDFWATNCGSCLNAIPNLNTMQKVFNADVFILPVSYEKTERVTTSFKKNPILKTSKLPTVTEDKVLTRLFPHLYISHLVWIDKQGIVRAFTHPEYVTSENIAAMLKNPSVNWPVKRDIANFDFKKNLLVLNSNNITSFSPQSIPYHSAVIPHIENVDYRYLTYTDSATNTFYFRMINLPIREMYLRSLGYDDFPISHVMVLTNDNERFIRDTKNSYKDSWDIKNTYCYEAALPLNITSDQRISKVKDDLDFYFGITGRLQNIKTRCLIISDLPNWSNTTNITIDEPEITVDDLVYLLNRSISSCPILNDAVKVKTVRIKINKHDKTDVESLKYKLSQQGLNLTEQDRTVKMFVIKDLRNLPVIN